MEQISFGGNLHWENVNARILTMFGMFGVTTPRNDASAGRGQWDLRGAYKYVSEANAGYHFNVNPRRSTSTLEFLFPISDYLSYYNFYDNLSLSIRRMFLRIRRGSSTVFAFSGS